VLFEELQAKRINLESKLSVSANAASQAPSKVGVRAGSTIKVEDAIQALTTKSANDVAVVIAENISGSVPDFAARMNRTAKKLGMNATTFRNPNGLPDNRQVTTARDLVKLSQGIQDRFPTYYKYFGRTSFTYKGTRYRNHNRLLGSVDGVDGIKTGYTRASGFNLVTNVRRGNRHIIAVVMGGKTGASRDAEMRKLISKYLPAGEKGDRTPALLVADSGEGVVGVEARMPRPRPVAASVATLAFAAPQAPTDIVSAALAETARPKTAAPQESPKDPITERISAASEVAELAFASRKDAAISEAVARLKEKAELRAGDRDMVAAKELPATKATAAEDADAEVVAVGWHIQIGAVPTEEGAQELLDEAQTSLGSVLASFKPFTAQVDRGGETLYRARFAGFSDKDDARATCAKLKSKSFSCLAVPNG
jgi:D-alanyl-D-alanine carboxypeptidase